MSEVSRERRGGLNNSAPSEMKPVGNPSHPYQEHAHIVAYKVSTQQVGRTDRGVGLIASTLTV